MMVKREVMSLRLLIRTLFSVDKNLNFATRRVVIEHFWYQQRFSDFNIHSFELNTDSSIVLSYISTMCKQHLFQPYNLIRITYCRLSNVTL